MAGSKVNSWEELRNKYAPAAGDGQAQVQTAWGQLRAKYAPAAGDGQAQVQTAWGQLRAKYLKTAPAVGETKPVVDETAPVVGETKPVVGETAPVVDETKPVVDEAEAARRYLESNPYRSLNGRVGPWEAPERPKDKPTLAMMPEKAAEVYAQLDAYNAYRATLPKQDKPTLAMMPEQALRTAGIVEYGGGKSSGYRSLPDKDQGRKVATWLGTDIRYDMTAIDADMARLEEEIAALDRQIEALTKEKEAAQLAVQKEERADYLSSSTANPKAATSGKYAAEKKLEEISKKLNAVQSEKDRFTTEIAALNDEKTASQLRHYESLRDEPDLRRRASM